MLYSRVGSWINLHGGLVAEAAVGVVTCVVSAYPVSTVVVSAVVEVFVPVAVVEFAVASSEGVTVVGLAVGVFAAAAEAPSAFAVAVLVVVAAIFGHLMLLLLLLMALLWCTFGGNNNHNCNVIVEFTVAPYKNLVIIIA